MPAVQPAAKSTRAVAVATSRRLNKFSIVQGTKTDHHCTAAAQPGRPAISPPIRLNRVSWNQCRFGSVPDLVPRPARLAGPAASASPVGSQDSMMIIACLGLRVGMHQRGSQPRQRMQQVVLCIDRDLVSLDRAGIDVDNDLTLGTQMMPDPA